MELNQIQSEQFGRSTEFLLARCDYAQNNPASAKKQLDIYLEKVPDNNEALTLRGRILVELDQPQEAAEELQKVVDRVPTDVLAREALGRALVQLNRKAESEGHFDFVKRASQAQSDMSRLIRQSIAEPENIEVRFTIAQLATEYVSPEDGAKWMRTVLEIQPNHPGANLALADYYQQRGDMAAASAHQSMVNGSK
jgi:predicted Zn-dependent protease